MSHEDQLHLTIRTLFRPRWKMISPNVLGSYKRHYYSLIDTLIGTFSTKGLKVDSVLAKGRSPRKNLSLGRPFSSNFKFLLKCHKKAFTYWRSVFLGSYHILCMSLTSMMPFPIFKVLWMLLKFSFFFGSLFQHGSPARWYSTATTNRLYRTSTIYTNKPVVSPGPLVDVSTTQTLSSTSNISISPQILSPVLSICMFSVFCMCIFN